MPVLEDFYRILQVHYLAEPEVIESAYRRLAKKYHPDVNKTAGAELRMKKSTRHTRRFATLSNAAPTTPSDCRSVRFLMRDRRPMSARLTSHRRPTGNPAPSSGPPGRRTRKRSAHLKPGRR